MIIFNILQNKTLVRLVSITQKNIQCLFTKKKKINKVQMDKYRII